MIVQFLGQSRFLLPEGDAMFTVSFIFVSLSGRLLDCADSLLNRLRCVLCPLPSTRNTVSKGSPSEGMPAKLGGTPTQRKTSQGHASRHAPKCPQRAMAGRRTHPAGSALQEYRPGLAAAGKGDLNPCVSPCPLAGCPAGRGAQPLLLGRSRNPS